MHPTAGPTFQDAISRLERFWADQGCLIWQPHNVSVGAGTMNPATFLRVLGPEAWNVAYVEPSVRPDDARYGENPNRMGRHHQYQVILKPDPGDPQGLFLDSLTAIGIDLARHDVRFVEDNWESPALGAWGLGWEVWLDGLEITQFTYFQQAGSLELDPVAVEITYGLDRILMALQDVRHFKDLRWSDRVVFADVHLPTEQETSRYYFEVASVERLNQLYDLYEAEAELAIEAGLIAPAHDYVLKCSDVFNVLDARGAVGVTERARYFGRMRKLARAVAEAYVAARTELEYPLLDEDRPWTAGGGEAAAIDDVAPAGAPDAPTEPTAYLLEVGTEELPVADLDAALAALRARVPELLASLRLVHGDVVVGGTPRRLAVLVESLAPRQEDVEAQVVGPPAERAFDDEGRPTKAAEGFARSAGVGPDALEVVERGGQQRVAAIKREAGRPAGEVLGEAWPEVLDGLPFGRSMRWNASRTRFSRPVRWLVALHGPAVVPLSYAGLEAGRVTRGLRPVGSPELPLADAGDYHKLMRTHGVLTDPDARRAEVERQVDAKAAAVAAASGGRAAVAGTGLLDEVANLVEQPHAIVGAFDEAYLELPAPVLQTVMEKHQRYFSLINPDNGQLLPHFITVANGGSVDADAVRHGNEAVIRARFADAAYFWKRDTAHALDDFTPALAKLTFQSDLGSMRDKVARLERLAPVFAARLGLSDEDAALALRAAALSKSDLASDMVVDMTSLQGVMGREYARRGGEPEGVAQAIYEHYLPKGTHAELPATSAGLVLALADRFDSLVGLFAVDVRPSGTQDPFALRRAALGITSLLVGCEIPFDVRTAIDETAAELPVPVDAKVKDDVLAFVGRRLEGQLRDAGHAADAVNAVLAVRAHNPYLAAEGVQQLEAHVARPDWEATLTAYARCARIVRDQSDGVADVDPHRFDKPAEQVLFDAVEVASENLDRDDINAVLHTLAALAPAIDTFFDEVLVMDEDEAVRANRIALVRRIATLPAYVADLSQLEGF